MLIRKGLDYMTQHDGYDREALSKYRMDTAKEDLKGAEILFNAGEYRMANNRAYYAIFHAISAIHALDGNAYKRHKDAIANFNKNYVKTEIFPRETGHMISKVELIRHASDYDDFYVASKEETSETIESARNFLDRVDIYIDNRIKQSNQVSE